MEKIMIFVENNFNEAELLYPFFRLREAGYKVDPIGPKANTEYTGSYGFHFPSSMHMKADIILAPEDVKVDDYVAVIIPGGLAPDRMRLNKGMVNIVKEAYEKGKVVAALCHGTWLPIEADIVRGKRATCWMSLITDLKNAGGIYENKSVVVDGNLVTSRYPDDLPDWLTSILKLLKKK